MSRIGNEPVPIPANVEVAVAGSEVTVNGPKGTLTQTFQPSMQMVFLFHLVAFNVGITK